ncbi:MAG: deoxyguanosinetriphosphate triphosphohydrolase [Oscillospiraceae bacterium]|jgi:dGTPase|nr:deoxyguanosinetriphosphate triphosphohydrolase [Oscillospiraceae bacterium]
MTVRESVERWEAERLSAGAVRAAESRGRAQPEEPCPLRTDFQRDTDRIVHTKAFRRLMHKTQVFLNPEGDHYRTRMTHTLEVTRVARTMARALHLNEDLCEAIGLGHDLGHTPFGHAGEAALTALMPGGFTHYAQSLRVVDRLERGGQGLNLTWEVRDGIVCHSGPVRARTLEGRLVHKADRIAYLSADIDDALRAGILTLEDIPRPLRARLGDTLSTRINAFVSDLVAHSRAREDIALSPPMEEAMRALRAFLFERVYKNPVAKGEETKARDFLQKLFEYYVRRPDELPPDMRAAAEIEGRERAVCDYIAGMTDRFAVARFEEIFVPKGWQRT